MIEISKERFNDGVEQSKRDFIGAVGAVGAVGAAGFTVAFIAVVILAALLLGQ